MLALSFAGLHERGQNRGVWIDVFNRSVKNPLGAPWCAGFVSYCLEQTQVTSPRVRTGWARGFIVGRESYTANDVALGRVTPQPGDLAIWTRNGGGHIGQVLRWSQSAGVTVEGNFRDAVRIMQRHLSPLSVFRITHFTRVSYEVHRTIGNE